MWTTEPRTCENELCHWGIKNQKWGIRRYRNPDGTLTEEGKARYEQRKETKQRKWERNPKNSVKLSDEDLDRVLTRLRKEDQLKQLSKTDLQKYAEQIAQKKISKGPGPIAQGFSKAMGSVVEKTTNKIMSGLLETKDEEDRRKAKEDAEYYKTLNERDDAKRKWDASQKPMTNVEERNLRSKVETHILQQLGLRYSQLNSTMGLDRDHQLTPYDEEVQSVIESVKNMSVDELSSYADRNIPKESKKK